MKRRIHHLGVLGLLALLAGCATIPIAGPVESESRRLGDEGQGPVTVVPQPPPHGALPEMIITGFLTAMASYGSDYATAREYLTTAAAEYWDPTSEVLIYASGTTPRAVGTQWMMQGQRIGRLEADGSFAAPDDTQWTHDFELVKENDEWRISNPPQGLALSQFMFSQSFMRVDAYFFAEPGGSLVPDQRYLPRGAWDRTTAARVVVDGPSEWLSPIVDHRPYRGISVEGEVALTADGVASVSLTPLARTLSTNLLTTLAIEIAATMRDLAGVQAVQLISDGLALKLLDGSSVLAVATANRYDSGRSDTSAPLMWLQDGVVFTTIAGVVSPVAGEWGVTPLGSQSLAAHEEVVAAVTADGLIMGPVGGESPTLKLAHSNLLRPQFDSAGHVWAVSGEGEVAVVLAASDRLVAVNTSTLAGMRIEDFHVSLDRHRILLVTTVTPPGEEPRQELGVALVAYERDTPVEISAYKPIRLTWEGAPVNAIVDIAWLGPSSLLVLGSSGKSLAEVFVADLDGLEVRERGRPQPWNPLQMATRLTPTGQQIAILDEDGTVWSYQEGFRWNRIVFNASAISYPV